MSINVNHLRDYRGKGGEISLAVRFPEILLVLILLIAIDEYLDLSGNEGVFRDKSVLNTSIYFIRIFIRIIFYQNFYRNYILLEFVARSVQIEQSDCNYCIHTKIVCLKML